MAETLGHKENCKPVTVSDVLSSYLAMLKAFGNTEITIPSSRALRRFIRKCIHYGNTDIPMPDAEQVGHFVKQCVKYGNTDIPVGHLVKKCIRFGKTVVVHCMTEKIDDSEDVMRAFADAMEYMQIKIRSRLRYLVQVAFFLIHGRDLCISTQCLIL